MFTRFSEFRRFAYVLSTFRDTKGKGGIKLVVNSWTIKLKELEVF